MFHHMTITEFRKDTARAADKTRRDHIPLLLTQGSKPPLVVMSLDDFGRYNDDTSFLMSNPRTHRELMEAMEDAEMRPEIFTEMTEQDLRRIMQHDKA